MKESTEAKVSAGEEREKEKGTYGERERERERGLIDLEIKGFKL